MVAVMIDNNRVSLISEVVSAFNTIMAAERKEVCYTTWVTTVTNHMCYHPQM